MKKTILTQQCAALDEVPMLNDRFCAETHTTDSTFTTSPTHGGKNCTSQGSDCHVRGLVEAIESALPCLNEQHILQNSELAQLSSPVKQMVEKKDLPKPTEDPPSILEEQDSDVQEQGKVSNNVIVCREWETNFTPGVSKEASQEKEPKSVFESISEVPERDTVLWQIKDFSDFRRAFQVTQLPHLVSPEFGRGCHLLLCLYDKKKHISGSVELPLLKATKDGVVHVKLTVVRPDMKAVVVRNVEIQVRVAGKNRTPSSSNVLVRFCLSKSRAFGPPRYQHLIFENQLRIRIELQYFPFDSRIFCRTAVPNVFRCSDQTTENIITADKQAMSYDVMSQSELLGDIRTYCQEETSQNIEIRRDDVVFHSCKFLLCARSKKFREIFSAHNSAAPKKDWSIRGFSTSFGHAKTQALSSITIRDIPVDVLDQILIFIHTDKCPWIEEHNRDVLDILELFEAADLYGVHSLTSRLISHLSQKMNIDNFVYMFEVSERCKDETLKQICTHFMDSLPGSQVATLMRATRHGYTANNLTSVS